MDLIIDTQVLSYRFKGIDKDIHNKSLAISSITANEFLITQHKDSEQPDYYIIHPARYPGLDSSNIPNEFTNPKWAKMGNYRTDHVIIDFGNQFSAYREFGNEAISEIINENKFGIYKISIAHLPKQKQKYLLKRLKYILDSGYHCYSLTKSALELALSLFSEFVSEHNCKGNVRNSVNDILILSTAIDRENSGMNPYLEQPEYWSDFHNQLVAAIARFLVPKLVPKYRVVTDKWVYKIAGSTAITIGRPDVSVQHSRRNTSANKDHLKGAVKEADLC